MAFSPPYIRLSRPQANLPASRAAASRARKFITDVYRRLDAFFVGDGGAASDSYGAAFTDDGQFIIAGFPPAVGPAAVAGAVQGFFDGVDLQSITHTLISYDEVGSHTVHLYASVEYVVDNGVDPEYSVDIFADTRIVLVNEGGSPRFKHVHVFFDVFPTPITTVP